MNKRMLGICLLGLISNGAWSTDITPSTQGSQMDRPQPNARSFQRGVPLREQRFRGRQPSGQVEQPKQEAPEQAPDIIPKGREVKKGEPIGEKKEASSSVMNPMIKTLTGVHRSISAADKVLKAQIEVLKNEPALGSAEAPAAKQSPIICLFIDGASVRGIAQFTILKAIEVQVNNRLRPFRKVGSPDLVLTDFFDFYGGTSAGSVNIGSILIPKDPTVVNTKDGKFVPKYTLKELDAMLPDTLAAAFSATTMRKIRTLDVGAAALLGSKFTAKDLEKKLQDVGGNARMFDVPPCVITSYDIRARELMNFSTFEACRKQSPDNPNWSYKNGIWENEMNVYLWEAIRASSAAPVFYKPLEMTIRGKDRALVDAGLFTMNPAVLGYVEARRAFPGRDMVVISISSGTLKDDIRKIRSKGASAGNVAEVLQATIETSLEGQQTLSDLLMKNLPGILNYHRLSFEVINKKFDDVTPKNIDDLKKAGLETTQTPEFNEAIESIVAVLKDRIDQKIEKPKFICPRKEMTITQEGKLAASGLGK